MNHWLGEITCFLPGVIDKQDSELVSNTKSLNPPFEWLGALFLLNTGDKEIRMIKKCFVYDSKRWMESNTRLTEWCLGGK